MTNAETRDYSALSDRELDALVAERVMEWVPWLEKRGQYTHVVWQRQEGREPWKESHRDYQQPERYTRITAAEIQPGKHITHYVGEDFRPSETWAGAGLVLEAMRERGFDGGVTLPHVRGTTWDARFWNEARAAGIGHHASAPRAVCIAALRAIEAGA